MKSSLLHLLLLLCGVCRGIAPASAEDCDDPAECDSEGETPVSFFIETSDHPGLLGKSYLDLRYHHMKLDRSNLGIVTPLDDTVQGLLMTTNLPLLALDELPGPFHYDLYSEFQVSLLHGDGRLGPPYNADASFDSDVSTLGIAMTVYAEPLESFRPFAQLGVLFKRHDETFFIDPATYVYHQRETKLLANFGFEGDISDRLAIRTAVDLNTTDGINHSVALAELIYWPYRRIYLRGGFYMPLQFDALGFLLGAGVTF